MGEVGLFETLSSGAGGSQRISMAGIDWLITGGSFGEQSTLGRPPMLPTREPMTNPPIEARRLGRSSPIAQSHVPTARLDRAGHDAPDLGKEML